MGFDLACDWKAGFVMDPAKKQRVGYMFHMNGLGMTDFLKHLEILLSRILERVLAEMGQQNKGRLGVLRHSVDMNYGHNGRWRLLRADHLRR